MTNPLQQKREYRILLLFMAGWFLVNSLQAALSGIDGDEAYYWMLSQQLGFGYFDHPPFVTLLMRLGETFGHGPFFTRLGTVLVTTLSIGIIYAGLPQRLRSVQLYLPLFAATLIFNVYSFIATPDAPLFFFTAIFFYAYGKYLQRASTGAVLLTALAIAGMFYSKYHGILPVFFVLLSNLRLLTRGSFWLIVLLVILLFLPHLYWQYSHDWPTVRFHLVERATHIYKIKYTTAYISGQLLIWGPLISLLFYFKLFRLKKEDLLGRAHQFTFLGTLAFFLFSSFKNNVQPHWTLVGGVSFVYLFLQILDRGTDKLRRIFLRLAIANIILIVIARILFLIPGSPVAKIKHYKPFFQAKAWADTIYNKAGNTPVIFPNSYAFPSLYRFYHPDVTTIGYNTKSYRKTHYDLIAADQQLNNKEVFIYRDGDTSSAHINVASAFRPGTLERVDSFTAVSTLKLTPLNLPEEAKAGSRISVNIELVNESRQTFSNRDQRLQFDYSFSRYSYQFENSPQRFAIPDSIITPGYRKQFTIEVQIPSDPGTHRFLLSIVNGSLQGNFASAYYPVRVQ